MLHNEIITVSGNVLDWGRFGDAVEKAISGRSYVQGQGKVDAYYHFKHLEVKTGSGELGRPGQKLLKGCSLVLYIPVPEITFDRFLNCRIELAKQEGFFLDKATFLEVLDSLGLIREKTSTAGNRVVSIQTIWNRKQGKPHSLKKFNLLIDALYDNCIMTLEEVLESEGLL